MFNSISSSWSLVKSSAKVLQSDKELVVFPIISSIAVLMLCVAFFVPMVLAGVLDAVSQNGLQFVHYLLLFIFYIIQYFIIFVCNTALVGAAIIRIRGGDPTVKDGLKIAFNHLGPIFLYSVIAATVGMLLSMIRERGNTIGKIVVSIIGFVWNVATFLVVPILAVEDVGPIEAIKRSVGYLKKTWGEQLVGSYSIGLVFGILFFVIAILAGIFAALAANAGAQAWVFISIIAVVIVFVLGISLISTTLTGIYTAAVYQYATTGQAGTNFDPEVVSGAFHSTEKKTLF